MGNPHPTNSKPVPIGKKHTNQPRTKARQRRENTRKRNHELKLAKFQKFNERVNAFWRGEIDEYPKFGQRQ